MVELNPTSVLSLMCCIILLLIWERSSDWKHGVNLEEKEYQLYGKVSDNAGKAYGGNRRYGEEIEETG